MTGNERAYHEFLTAERQLDRPFHFLFFFPAAMVSSLTPRMFCRFCVELCPREISKQSPIDERRWSDGAPFKSWCSKSKETDGAWNCIALPLAVEMGSAPGPGHQ